MDTKTENRGICCKLDPGLMEVRRNLSISSSGHDSYRMVWAAGDLRKSLVQPSAQGRVNAEFWPGCLGQLGLESHQEQGLEKPPGPVFSYPHSQNPILWNPLSFTLWLSSLLPLCI